VKNHSIWLLSIGITIGSPFVGFFFSGWSGVLVGLAFGAVSYKLGPKAIMKCRSIVENR
jgi:hypothetical protein